MLQVHPTLPDIGASYDAGAAPYVHHSNHQDNTACNPLQFTSADEQPLVYTELQTRRVGLSKPKSGKSSTSAQVQQVANSVSESSSE